MRWTPHRAPVAALAMICAALLASCGGGETQVTTESPSASGPTGSTGSTAPPGATGTTGSPESPTPDPLPTPLTGTVLHGERYFGVYLAVAPFDAPELDAAVQQLADLGVLAFPGDIACDQGAAEQLGVPSDVAAVAIYFERRPDAQAWLDALDPPALGIAMVRTFCAD